MSKTVNINSKMTLWEAIKVRIAIGNTDVIEVKHENTGIFWLALSVLFSTITICATAQDIARAMGLQL